MTPAEVYRAMVGQAEAAGLKRARSPFSAKRMPDNVMDRSFQVLPISDNDTAEGRRAADRRMVMQSRFDVETIHDLTAARGKGDDSVAVMLDDQVRIIQEMWRLGTTLQAGNTRVAYGGSTRAEAAGGQHMITTIRFVVQHHVPLTTGDGDT